MALSVDGNATAVITGATSGSVSLTTGGAGDIIVIALAAEIYNSTATPTISSVTSSGLTFANRKTLAGNAVGLYSHNNGYGSILALYWAYASAKLTAQSITVTLGQTVDCGAIVAFAVAGANTTTPFDVNGSLPATTTSSTHAAVNVTASGISTSNANTMLIGALGAFNNSGSATWPQAVGSGFTAIANKQNQAGTLEADCMVEQQIVSATQASATLGYTGTYTDFYLIMDAIQAAGGAAVNAKYARLRQYLRR